MTQKILIIDDDIDTLKLVGIMLERKGFTIIASTTGKKGIQLAQKELPDLIILDIMIPDIDGYEVARTIRSTPGTEAIPIIMFTAKSQVDDKVEGLEAGADAYITKPARPRELFAQVNSILKRAPQRAAGAQQVEEPQGTLIGIISTKGGLGISTLAINLAVEIQNQSGEETILTDFRPGQGTICMDLDQQNTEAMIRLLETSSREELADRLGDSLLEHKTGIMTLLSSYHPQDTRYLSRPEKFQEIAQEIKSLAPFTVVDLGTYLHDLDTKVLPECNKILICLEPSPSTITQTKILIQDLINAGLGEGRFITVLINRQRSGVQLSWEQAEDQLGRKIDHIFTPVPELAFQAAKTNIPMVQRAPDSMTAEQFQELASAIID